MNFNIEKFVNFNVTGFSPYRSSEGGCIKCAMLESLGYNTDYTLFTSRVPYDQSGEMFKKFGGQVFTDIMNQAEMMLMSKVPVEEIKKFVIDGMLEQGLIKTEEVECLNLT